MKINDLKRSLFFWIEKLQISRSERISIALLLLLLVVLLSSNLFLSTKFQYDQAEYDKILEEFNRRSALLDQQKEEQAAKYNPEIIVSDSQSTTSSLQIPHEDKLNINTATQEQLQTLEGIGEVYARNIVEYRETHGGFDSIEDLVNVNGIGKKRLDNIRPFIKLE